jgi:hypothetical protein
LWGQGFGPATGLPPGALWQDRERMAASDQLLTVLVTSAVPTLAVLIGILVNDFRWNVLVRAFSAGSAMTNRHCDNLKNVRQACLNRSIR